MKRILARVIPVVLGIGTALLITYIAIQAVQAPPIQLKLIADGFDVPLDLVSAHDGTGRLFVVDKLGTISIIYADGTLAPEPFLDIHERITTEIERGLLGLAFSPDYAENGKFYVNYTDLEGDTVIAEFRVSDDPDAADPDSERKLIGVFQPASNHNGGHLLFGPDGYLWAGLGDGGGGEKPDKNSQDLTTLLGKMIRIDVNNRDEDDDLPYDIPADNPYVGEVDARDEIWALGFRNPWRFSFDAATGDLYVADVGEDRYEELSVLPAPLEGGANFGWNIMEGLHCNPLEYSDDECDKSGLVMPVIEYEHGGGRIAITGGEVYRGSAMPWLVGNYLFSDYGSGEIWATSEADGWQQTLLLDTRMFIDSFGVDEAGELYVVDLRRDAIYKIVPRTLWGRLIAFTERVEQ